MLEGKVAVVTGAGHGIGRGHALELARHGARVVVNDLGSSVSGEGSSKDADLTVELIGARGGTAAADYGNVADEADAEAMIQHAIDEWGRLDILVNNAGIVRDGAIWNLTTESWDAVMGVHVRGPWLTSRRSPSLAIARQGRPGQPGSHHQHDVGGRARWQFRSDELHDRQGSCRGAHADPRTRVAASRGHGERHRTGRSDTHHGHDA